ncbi:MAG: P-II family nitrogen regulator [Planctomycetes bacterium]|nr:P-II family nitrogen regulator [Planctomycetota bacterium]
MKLIVAYIRPEVLNAVKQELYKREVHKISITNALGHGEEHGYHESYRGVGFEVNMLKKIRIEIAVNEEFVERTVEAIMTGAKTGAVGDGKIFVLECKQVYRIRTGETGKDAIG